MLLYMQDHGDHRCFQTFSQQNFKERSQWDVDGQNKGIKFQKPDDTLPFFSNLCVHLAMAIGLSDAFGFCKTSNAQFETRWWYNSV